MTNCYFFSFSMLFASLFNFFGGKEEPYKNNEAYMNKIINRSIKQLENRYGLVPIGSGGGNIDNKSRKETVSFHLYHKLTKEEARILIIEIVELLLHNINIDKVIAPYLYNFPFTYKNIEATVFIYEKDESDLFDPNIGLISLTRRGTINYVTYLPNSKWCEYATDVEEPYEQAYKIVTQKDYPHKISDSKDTFNPKG